MLNFSISTRWFIDRSTFFKVPIMKTKKKSTLTLIVFQFCVYCFLLFFLFFLLLENIYSSLVLSSLV